MVTRLAGDQETDTCGRRLSLFVDLNLLDYAAKFDGFHSLDLKEFGDVFNLVYFATNKPARLQDFLGISKVNNPTNEVDWVARDFFLPMITAGQKPVFAADINTFAALDDARFEPLRTVYLPLEAQGQIQATNAANARILSSNFGAQSCGDDGGGGADVFPCVAGICGRDGYPFMAGELCLPGPGSAGRQASSKFGVRRPEIPLWRHYLAGLPAGVRCVLVFTVIFNAGIRTRNR